MAEMRVAKGTGRRIGRMRQERGSTGNELVKVGPCGLDKETGGEVSRGRVTVLGPVKRTWRGNGLERLERAADRRLGRDSETLADILLEKAKEGKVESARLLVSLAEHGIQRKPREQKKKRTGTSWVNMLASEPEYVEEKPEIGDVWVGEGWRKKTGELVRE